MLTIRLECHLNCFDKTSSSCRDTASWIEYPTYLWPNKSEPAAVLQSESQTVRFSECIESRTGTILSHPPQRSMRESNIENLSIYLTEIESKKYLFSYLEYTGNAFDGDMKQVDVDPIEQQWFKQNAECHISILNDNKKGTQRMNMRMVKAKM